jgi:hypothetical protein
MQKNRTNIRNTTDTKKQKAEMKMARFLALVALLILTPGVYPVGVKVRSELFSPSLRPRGSFALAGNAVFFSVVSFRRNRTDLNAGREGICTLDSVGSTVKAQLTGAEMPHEVVEIPMKSEWIVDTLEC